jgi:voltage-gated sodium channel
MIGWSLFGDEDSQHWGNIGEAMLTLFVMLTLENFPVYLERGREIGSVIYVVNFILIGVVLNSLPEAREIH